MSQETGKIGLVGEVSTTINNNVHSGGLQRRIGMTGVIPRRGGRKKTLSLNPEEREALENLIEEVIIDGGMGDSESGSSDEEDNSRDSSSKEKPDDNLSSNTGETSDDSKTLLAFKMSKKFYPGQLKVALKHMTDLPPRFSRKLKKAEKYLEMNVTQKKSSVSTSIKEEEEEEVISFNMTSNSTTLTPDSTTLSASPKPIQNDKTKTQKEKTQKDLKKTIRSLLTDLDQYVDERDRTSISLDLPGAVSCADLERETLAYSIKSSESVTLPSPNAEVKISKVENVEVNTSSIEPPGVKRHKALNITTKPTPQVLKQLNQSSTPKSFPISVPSSSMYMTTLPPSAASKMSGIDNTQQHLCADKSAFQHYSNMASTHFIDTNSIIMPVQSIMPQMPQIDFSVPPPTTFQYPAKYGMSSPQEPFLQSKMQYQPQYGFVELPAGASAQTHAGSNFVGTTPVIFQQYNTLPIASQHQQIPPLPYTNNPGYFIRSFPARPVNYMPQFQTSSPILNNDSSFKSNINRHNNVVSKNGTNVSNIGNFRAPIRSGTNQPPLGSTKVDMITSKNKLRTTHNYTMQEAPRQGLSMGHLSTNVGNYTTSPEIQVKQINSPICGMPRMPTITVHETLDVPEINLKYEDQILKSPTSQSSPTNPSSVDKIDVKSSGDISKSSTRLSIKSGSTSSDDLLSEEIVESFESSNEPEFCSTLDGHRRSIDIELGTEECDDGKTTGLQVLLGESFTRKLTEMFVDGDSTKNYSISKPVFLNSRVLKQIFMSLSPSPAHHTFTN